MKSVGTCEECRLKGSDSLGLGGTQLLQGDDRPHFAYVIGDWGGVLYGAPHGVRSVLALLELFHHLFHHFHLGKATGHIECQAYVTMIANANQAKTCFAGPKDHR